MTFIMSTKQIHCVIEMKSTVALGQVAHIVSVLIFEKGKYEDTIATRIPQTYTKRFTQKQEVRRVKYNNILLFLLRNVDREV
jgi:hypothetical protein